MSPEAAPRVVVSHPRATVPPASAANCTATTGWMRHVQQHYSYRHAHFRCPRPFTVAALPRTSGRGAARIGRLATCLVGDPGARSTDGRTLRLRGPDDRGRVSPLLRLAPAVAGERRDLLDDRRGASSRVSTLREVRRRPRTAPAGRRARDHLHRPAPRGPRHAG